ncbi:MAG TPA: DUF2007 domain-containing protein [Vicinamibacterales bacterium]|nr:DUF2007 domain-containing protein [Vicinamibacterales bacterium]
MKLVAVGEFPNRIEAEIAQGALEAADIESYVSGDDAGGLQPGLWMAGAIRLFVREPDAARARALLNP